MKNQKSVQLRCLKKPDLRLSPERSLKAKVRVNTKAKAGEGLRDMFSQLSTLVPSLRERTEECQGNEVEQLPEEEMVESVIDYINELKMVLQFSESMSTLIEASQIDTESLPPSPQLYMTPFTMPLD